MTLYCRVTTNKHNGFGYVNTISCSTKKYVSELDSKIIFSVYIFYMSAKQNPPTISLSEREPKDLKRAPEKAAKLDVYYWTSVGALAEG